MPLEDVILRSKIAQLDLQTNVKLEEEKTKQKQKAQEERTKRKEIELKLKEQTRQKELAINKIAELLKEDKNNPVYVNLLAKVLGV